MEKLITKIDVDFGIVLEIYPVPSLVQGLVIIHNWLLINFLNMLFFFSSPGRSPGRATVLPSASALVSVLALAAALALAKGLMLKLFM